MALDNHEVLEQALGIAMDRAHRGAAPNVADLLPKIDTLTEQKLLTEVHTTGGTFEAVRDGDMKWWRADSEERDRYRDFQALTSTFALDSGVEVALGFCEQEPVEGVPGIQRLFGATTIEGNFIPLMRIVDMREENSDKPGHDRDFSRACFEMPFVHVNDQLIITQEDEDKVIVKHKDESGEQIDVTARDLLNLLEASIDDIDHPDLVTKLREYFHVEEAVANALQLQEGRNYANEQAIRAFLASKIEQNGLHVFNLHSDTVQNQNPKFGSSKTDISMDFYPLEEEGLGEIVVTARVQPAVDDRVQTLFTLRYGDRLGTAWVAGDIGQIPDSLEEYERFVMDILFGEQDTDGQEQEVGRTQGSPDEDTRIEAKAAFGDYFDAKHAAAERFERLFPGKGRAELFVGGGYEDEILNQVYTEEEFNPLGEKSTEFNREEFAIASRKADAVLGGEQDRRPGIEMSPDWNSLTREEQVTARSAARAIKDYYDEGDRSDTGMNLSLDDFRVIVHSDVGRMVHEVFVLYAAGLSLRKPALFARLKHPSHEVKYHHTDIIGSPTTRMGFGNPNAPIEYSVATLLIDKLVDARDEESSTFAYQALFYGMYCMKRNEVGMLTAKKSGGLKFKPLEELQSRPGEVLNVLGMRHYPSIQIS